MDIEPQIFLGFQKDSAFETHCKKSNAALVKMLCGEGYLQEIKFAEALYLGKFLPPLCTLDEFEAFEAHIFSLLKKLAPPYPFADNCLKLLPLIHDELS